MQKYAGMAFQFLAVIGVAVWLGWQIDKRRSSDFPLFTTLFPLVVIIGLIVKAIRDTGRGNNG